MTRRTWLLLLLAALLALCLAACSSNERTTTTTQETPATDTALPDEPETPEPAPEVATEPEVVSDIDDVASLAPEDAFSGAADALASLDSYRYSTLFTFVGEEGDEVEAGSIELMGIVAGPDEKHLIWMDLVEETRFEVVQIGEQAWIYDDAGWRVTMPVVAEAMSQAVLIYAPSVAWGGVFGELEPNADYVGRETVNGVSAHHYAATYAQWGTYWPGELENAAGDIWIAEDGYPVKYVFSATGVGREGERGTVTWRMDLADVNTEITIDPPVLEEDSPPGF